MESGGAPDAFVDTLDLETDGKGETMEWRGGHHAHAIHTRGPCQASGLGLHINRLVWHRMDLASKVRRDHSSPYPTRDLTH